jgi:toxin-antitoxin system PIN domain toxin
MILIDAHLLLYAKVADYPQHLRAAAWLEARLNAPDRVGLPWPSLLAFLRLMTNPRLFVRPLRLADAWAQVEEWLALPPVWIPMPTAQHAARLGPLLRIARSTANLVPDAHLAALALEHDLTLCSSDQDFARFPGLRWENPLADLPPTRENEPGHTI